MSTDTQLATQPSKAPILADERGVKLDSLAAMWRFAEMAVNSGIYKDLNDNPSVAIIKIQAGAELGLSPVWSLTNIFVVNGKPTVYGDALLGIVLAHPQCEDVIETSEGGELAPAGKVNTAYTAVCEVRRKGRMPVIRKFSVADAQKAGIFGKNVHQYYPARMLAMRARAFACRDAFADALRGLGVREEMESVTEPKRIHGREVATGLVLPDETISGASPVHSGESESASPAQPETRSESSGSSEGGAKRSGNASRQNDIEPADQDGADPTDYSKGDTLFK